MKKIRQIGRLNEEMNPKGVNWLIVLIGICLHQSYVYQNINLSAADFFMVLFIGQSIFLGRFKVPIFPLLFFIAITATTLFTACYVTPVLFSITTSPQEVTVGWMKLLSLFLYFVSGYFIAMQRKERDFLVAFSLTGLLVGIVGILLSAFPTGSMHATLFLSNIRYKGFLNDPNLYAIMTVAAFAIFMEYFRPRIWTFIALWVVLFWCVVIAGSKTGVIVLICYFLFKFMQKHLRLAKPRLNTVWLTLSLLLIGVCSQIFTKWLFDFMDVATQKIPGMSRVMIVFSDLYTALGEGGSDRIQVWHNACGIIKESPFLGVGVGTYGDVANALYGNGLIAHNTYLQLFAEWGIPISMVFLFYVFYCVFKNLKRPHSEQYSNAYCSGIIVFLIASMGISLNNARLFWICLGAIALVQYSWYPSNRKIDNKDVGYGTKGEGPENG